MQNITGRPEIDQMGRVGQGRFPTFGRQPMFGQGRRPVDSWGFGGGDTSSPSRSPSTPQRGAWDLPEDGDWDTDASDMISGMRVTGPRQYGGDGISSPSNRRSNDPGYWQDKMDELRGMSNFVDPSMDWGDDDWQDVYEPGDAVNVKSGGNENFGKSWNSTSNSWEDVGWDDPSVASMSAESRGWDDDYQQGIREAWENNDEVAFQRWRNLARANETSKLQNATPTIGGGTEPGYSLPKQPGKSQPKKPAPTTPTPPPTSQPDPWPKKQRPIY